MKTLLLWALEYILNWIAKQWRKSQAEAEKQKEIEEKTKKEAEAIKNAETEDELEKAAKDLLSRK